MKQLVKIIRGINRHPLASKNKVAGIKRFLKWQFVQKLMPYPIICPFVDDSKLAIEKGMHGATGNLYTGLLEFSEMAFVLHVLRKGDLFGDIGANVGVFSVLASANAGADSIAVEPIPQTYAGMLRNIKLNNIEGKVSCLQIGVGDVETTLRFTKDSDTTNGVASSQTPGVDTIEVPVKTLDTLFKDKSPCMLKIDVEGYEWQVLNGAKTTLEKSSLKAIIIEINGSGSAYNISDDQIHDYLCSFGFVPYNYDPFSRRTIPLSTYRDTNTIYIRDMDWVNERLASAQQYSVIGQTI